MSFSSLVTAATLTPVPSSISNLVTVGPRRTATTRASTPNCASMFSSDAVMSFMTPLLPVLALPLRSRSSGGST